jgi:hypothetical protein
MEVPEPIKDSITCGEPATDYTLILKINDIIAYLEKEKDKQEKLNKEFDKRIGDCVVHCV